MVRARRVGEAARTPRRRLCHEQRRDSSLFVTQIRRTRSVSPQTPGLGVVRDSDSGTSRKQVPPRGASAEADSPPGRWFERSTSDRPSRVSVTLDHKTSPVGHVTEVTVRRAMPHLWGDLPGAGWDGSRSNSPVPALCELRRPEGLRRAADPKAGGDNSDSPKGLAAPITVPEDPDRPIRCPGGPRSESLATPKGAEPQCQAIPPCRGPEGPQPRRVSAPTATRRSPSKRNQVSDSTRRPEGLRIPSNVVPKDQ